MKLLDCENLNKQAYSPTVICILPVIDDIIKGSGFKDTVYEAGLMRSGSLYGTLTLSHGTLFFKF